MNEPACAQTKVAAHLAEAPSSEEMGGQVKPAKRSGLFPALSIRFKTRNSLAPMLHVDHSKDSKSERRRSASLLLALVLSLLGISAGPLGPAQASEGDTSVTCVPRISPPTAGLNFVKREQLTARSSLYTFRSAAVGPDATPDGLVRVRVIVPSGYDEARNRKTRYPVLYYLHGTGGNATSFPTDDLESIIDSEQVILVTPDGGTIGGYTDWFGSNIAGYNRVGASPATPPAWETFHIRELLPWIDENLRTNKSRAIEGSSMGGMGAMAYAARYPGVFKAAASFSGAVDTQIASAGSETLLSAIWDPCTFGDPVLQEQNWAAHNPTALAGKLHGVSLFVASGNGLPGRYDSQVAAPEAYALEAMVYEMSQNFVRALQAADVPAQTWFYGSGSHPYPGPSLQYDIDDMRMFLPQAMTAMAK
jgi:diacylglycerol O-acyltransferase / trehalose O-mycolyltransferase